MLTFFPESYQKYQFTSLIYMLLAGHKSTYFYLIPVISYRFASLISYHFMMLVFVTKEHSMAPITWN